MSGFSSLLSLSHEFQSAKRAIKEKSLPMGIIGLSTVHKAHYISSLCEDLERKCLIVCADENSASKLCDDLNVFSSGAVLYPSRSISFRPTESQSREFEQKRIGVLSKILDGDYKYILCSVQGAMQLTMPKQELKKRSIKIKSGQDISPEEIIRVLLSAGYIRQDQVDATGQFSLRGGILDIFAPGMDKPCRIEFWGDSIDSISLFDIESQRRTDVLDFVKITPSAEVLFDSAEAMKEKLEAFLLGVKGKGSVKIKESIREDIDKLQHEVHISASDRYLDLAYSELHTIFDYMKGELLFVSESNDVKQRAETYCKFLNEDIKEMFLQGVLTKGIDRYILSWNEMLKYYTEFGAIYTDNLARGSFDTSVKALVSVEAQQHARWNGTMSYLLEDVRPAIENGYRVVVFAGTEKSAKELAFDLQTEELNSIYFSVAPGEFPKNTVSVLPGSLSAGFEYNLQKIMLLTYGTGGAQGSVRKRKKAKKGKGGLTSLDEINKGDYVVHSAYGIGLYDGIHTLRISGVTKDFLKIKYRGTDVLYLPVTQLDLLTKYISVGDSDKAVKLNKLGTDEWKRTRYKVKTAVKELARQLIAIYSKRLKSEGFAFSSDMDMQNDFERRFEYEETDDQIEAVNEIKRDMEKTAPMDRLLCGDVGFGKTEVALRAAFKCVADGKQCAILVPTTILAFQHFGTLKKRFDGFPIEIEMISRFRTQSEKTKIKKALKRGSIDIIVGTHSLIAKSVEFKDLGLLIVDEEQRFGVAQKEKLKERFPLVDVLTLSATPIPRTLNMAMTGIRDMSVLEIPPEGRHPVQTYVLAHDMGVLSEAMERELRRGGQVYYLRNKIDGIERVAEEISKYLPHARIGIGHGKMSEDELGEVWRQLLENEIDILVCTTIIETGVDVPNANTLIIEEAERLGLAQLHQIRGRVGRSHRRAYAYFTYNGHKVLTDVAQKRLSAIREFTEFGAGFQVAQRDLEIRGAGDVLGSQQHGHMDSVGYDTYLEILSEAITEETTGERVQPKKECTVDVLVDAHIPENYITSSKHRIYMYKRIAEIESGEDAMDVMDEFIDRFGEIPDSVQGLIDVSLLRAYAAKLGIYEIKQEGNMILAFLDDLPSETIFSIAASLGRKGTLIMTGKPCIRFRISNKSTIATMKELITVLSDATRRAEA